MVMAAEQFKKKMHFGAGLTNNLIFYTSGFELKKPEGHEGVKFGIQITFPQ